jgi:hypothetical protein
MSVNPQNSEARDHQDEPTYWVAVLEIARERDDFERAAQANRELRRLGVRVRYEMPKTGKGVAR